MSIRTRIPPAPNPHGSPAPRRRAPWPTAAGTLLLLAAGSAAAQGGERWALDERFDGDPASPSQALLPDDFDYVATHRMQPGESFDTVLGPFPADHDEDCAGPDPEVVPTRRHDVITTQTSSGADPDPSFFICKNHMMSSMGEVGPYSVSAFWPRQSFDFSDGGTLMFDVNINEGHTERHWWEIMIVPREQLKVGAGPVDSAVDETYPLDRIVFDFRKRVRGIKVGTGALAPAGWLVNERQFGPYDFSYWGVLHPNDPATRDRRIRRTMRIDFEDERIVWRIRTADGRWDSYGVDVPGGLPFERGLVVFKTHSYTPIKENNTDVFTFHWDNIRFDGPVVGRYDAHHADDVVYLQRNGNRPEGDSRTVTIDVPDPGEAPVLFGQINSPKRGQVLLGINGRPAVSVDPYQYDRGDGDRRDGDGCYSSDWKSFRLPLDPALLRAGTNTFEWTVGPRTPDCDFGPYDYDGFSVKFLQVQTER